MVAMADTVSDTGVQSILNEPRTGSPKSTVGAMALVEEAEKSLKTTAHVMAAALSKLRPDSAVVLLFVDQMTTSKDTPDPATSASVC